MKPLDLALGIALTKLSATPTFVHDRNYDETYYPYARVVNVEPLYRTIQVSTLAQECYEKTVPHRRSGGDSYTGLIAGGLIGGVPGSAGAVT